MPNKITSVSEGHLREKLEGKRKKEQQIVMYTTPITPWSISLSSVSWKSSWNNLKWRHLQVQMTSVTKCYNTLAAQLQTAWHFQSYLERRTGTSVMEGNQGDSSSEDRKEQAESPGLLPYQSKAVFARLWSKSSNNAFSGIWRKKSSLLSKLASEDTGVQNST